MKNKITLILLITGIMSMRSQVELYESFAAPFNPSANGWYVENLSSAVGTNTTGWFQGNATVFNSLAGGPDDYYAADMNSASSAGATNTISCWLITPTLNLVNGAWFQFVTRGSKLPVNKADRMQIYYSIGTGTNVGTTAGTATNSAGTFTNLVMDLNQTMTLFYSANWSAYTASLTGIPTPTVGRLAFRYYVPNGGPGGPNGNYIGIDEFRYSQPCARPEFFGDPFPGVAACVGVPTPFMIYQVSQTNPVTSYTWDNGTTTSTTSIVPTNTGTTAHWTLGETTPGCQALDVSYYFADVNPTIQVTENPNTAICSGAQVTVNTTGANTYTYLLGTSSFTQNPIVLTAPNVPGQTVSHFTVAGMSQGGCVTKQTVTLQVNPAPTLSVTASKTVICVNGTTSLSASGASTYSWAGVSSSTMSSISYSNNTAGVKQFTVYGVSADGCRSADVVKTVTVSNCTGIEEEEETTKKINAYPNPFNDVLYLEPESDNILAELYDYTGKCVATVKNNLSLNTAALPAGIYFLRVIDAQKQEQRLKLVKP